MSTASALGRPPATPPAPATTHRFWPALLTIVAVGAVIRVLYTLLEAPWPPPALDDQYYFSALPKLIADGQGFIAPFRFDFQRVTVPTAEHPPLHSVVLAGFATLGLESPDAQRLTGTLFGAGTIAALGVLGRRLAGERAGLIAAGLAALYPVLIAADGALMSESLFGLLVALALLAAFRLVEAPSIRRAVVLGALAGLAALTRGEALLLLPLILLPVLRRPGGVRAALLCVVAAAVVCTPWTVRNWIAFDEPVLISTNSGSAVGGANCRETFYGAQLGGWRPQCLKDSPGDEPEHMADLRRAGVAYARENAGRLPVVLAARLGRVWSVYDPAQTPEGRSVRVHKLGVVAFFLLVPAAITGAVLLRRRRRPGLWILLVPFLVVCVTALTTYGNQRFRQPADLALVVLAAVALSTLWARRAGRGTGAAATRA